MISARDRRPRTVSSLFLNLETLLGEFSPRAGRALLGARWGFSPPPLETRQELCEYSFPLGPVPFPQILAARTGVRIVEHGQAAAGLEDHLLSGAPAIVAVDSFHLPYRPAFGRVHSHRTILVRRGRARSEVRVEDAWPPSYVGSLPIANLETARRSTVPLERRLEPVYAGRPVDREWWSVDLLPLRIHDPAAWATALLQEILLDATAPPGGGGGGAGLTAFARFRGELLDQLARPEERFERAREASLLLRAELSSRVYLCALLRAAAGWTARAELRGVAELYQAGLRHLERARDILIKSLNQYRPEYLPYLAACLAAALANEERLAASLASFAGAVAVRQRKAG